MLAGMSVQCDATYTVEPVLSGIMTVCRWPDNKKSRIIEDEVMFHFALTLRPTLGNILYIPLSICYWSLSYRWAERPER
jgi:hypothetical protein